MNSKSNNKSEICLFKDVCKTFSSKIILQNLNFSFKKGKNYLIKGESGVGKTTLLNIIMGIEKVDTGSVLYNDSPKLEYMFQDVLLFPSLTVRDNLFLKEAACGLTVESRSVVEFHNILNQVGLTENILTEKVSFLSGGEKRRLQLAQIMLTNPQLILFDEPTANLDRERKNSILDLLDATFAKATKIIVSHDFEQYNDRDYVVLELRKGKLNYV